MKAVEIDLIFKVEDMYETAIEKLKLSIMNGVLVTRLTATKVPITSQDTFMPAND